MAKTRQDPRAIFHEFLAKTGARWTPEREAILEAVFAIHRHFGADELYDWLRERDHRVSRATIYRTLDLLVKSGLVSDLDLGDGRTSFEHVFGHEHHDHLICTTCGRTIEFEEGDIEQLQQAVCRRMGFRAERHSLRIFGTCKNCQAEQAAAS